MWWGGAARLIWWRSTAYMGLQSHFIVKPNLVLRLGWGFDNYLQSYINLILSSNKEHDIAIYSAPPPLPPPCNTVSSNFLNFLKAELSKVLEAIRGHY